MNSKNSKLNKQIKVQIIIKNNLKIQKLMHLNIGLLDSVTQIYIL